MLRAGAVREFLALAPRAVAAAGKIPLQLAEIVTGGPVLRDAPRVNHRDDRARAVTLDALHAALERRQVAALVSAARKNGQAGWGHQRRHETRLHRTAARVAEAHQA